MMKAIAEYFRGLSQEDSQLGAASDHLAPAALKQFVQERSTQSIDAELHGDAFILRASKRVDDADVVRPSDAAMETILAGPDPMGAPAGETPVNSEDAALLHAAELERRAKARLMALRRELDPLIEGEGDDAEDDLSAQDDRQLSDEPTVSEILRSKRDLLPEISMKEESISRLLDEAENKIDGAESRRRNISIAHLKAAVAANAEDTKSGERDRVMKRKERQKDPYRRDLAHAVGKSVELERSRNAEAHPAAAHSAGHVPLMLVSNQRIAEEAEFAEEQVEQSAVVAKAALAPAMPDAVPTPVAPPPAEAETPAAPVAKDPAGPSEPPAYVDAAPVAPEPAVEAKETPQQVEAPAEEVAELTPETPEPRPEPEVAVDAPAIDTPAEQGVEPVEAEAENIAPPAEEPEEPAATEEDGMDFAAFAEARGAQSLSDLLEAALAFAARNTPDGAVKRPDIMTTVAAHLGEASYSREAAMGAFGILLREGRIVKLPKGFFTLP